MYRSVKETAECWHISDRRVRVLCEEGKVPGAVKEGRSWRIPKNALKPADGRGKRLDSLKSDIAATKALIETLRPFTKGESKRLLGEFAIEYTYNSNAIEGSTLTLRETDLALRGLTIDCKPLSDHLDAIGHKEAFDYVCEIARENLPLSVMDVRHVHSLVLASSPQDAGAFRQIPVTIAGALHRPPDPFDIPELLQGVIDRYLASEEDVLERLARFHIEFEAVHPFIDGNGRSGRLLLNLELLKLGYPPIDIRYTQRARYYDAFDAYHAGKGVLAMAKLIGDTLAGELHRRAELLAART